MGNTAGLHTRFGYEGALMARRSPSRVGGGSGRPADVRRQVSGPVRRPVNGLRRSPCASRTRIGPDRNALDVALVPDRCAISIAGHKRLPTRSTGILWST